MVRLICAGPVMKELDTFVGLQADAFDVGRDVKVVPAGGWHRWSIGAAVDDVLACAPAVQEARSVLEMTIASATVDVRAVRENRTVAMRDAPLLLFCFNYCEQLIGGRLISCGKNAVYDFWRSW
jgi:hypothetical protein